MEVWADFLVFEGQREGLSGGEPMRLAHVAPNIPGLPRHLSAAGGWAPEPVVSGHMAVVPLLKP